MNTQTRGAIDKVQCLLPSSSSHKPGMRDLLVGPPGYTLHASDTLPLPQLHNWETGALESKAVSKTLANTDTHLKIPSYLPNQVQLCFLPYPNERHL